MALKAIKPQTRSIGGRLKAPAKLADPFYQSTEWKALTSEIKRQRGYVCDDCGGDFRRRRDKLVGDHIVERKDGGAELDPLNIQCLCIYCHNRKTARSRLQRQTGGASKV